MEIYRRIGERIRHARLRVGLTQPELAEFLGVSKGIISRWETGLARPSLDRLEPLARRLGLSIEELLGFAVAEGAGAYRARSLPVWDLGRETVPDFRPQSAIGNILVSEEEALAVQAALRVSDDAFSPHFCVGDVVGVETLRRQPKLGDIIFIRRGGKLTLRRFGGRRKGFVLIPLQASQDTEVVERLEVVGIYRWLRRPGQVTPRD